MDFLYNNSWYVPVSTQVGDIELLVDTGAKVTCLSLKDLCVLLERNVENLIPYLSKLDTSTLKSIQNLPINVWVLTLPKINIGGTILPSFYCYVSDAKSFQSVLGMDVLQFGFMKLQYKDKGSLEYFDYESYFNYKKNIKTGRLSFLDYD